MPQGTIDLRELAVNASRTRHLDAPAGRLHNHMVRDDALGTEAAFRDCFLVWSSVPEPEFARFAEPDYGALVSHVVHAFQHHVVVHLPASSSYHGKLEALAAEHEQLRAQVQAMQEAIRGAQELDNQFDHELEEIAVELKAKAAEFDPDEYDLSAAYDLLERD